MLHWRELPKKARQLLIAVDVDELPDGLGDVGAVWDAASPELVRRLWWPWWVYLLREWIEVACERSLDKHACVRAEYRASGLELRHDARFELCADQGLVEHVVVAERRPPFRPRSKRRRTRAPPADGEDDPDPVDLARSGRRRCL
jgi:hypothetical protein